MLCYVKDIKNLLIIFVSKCAVRDENNVGICLNAGILTGVNPTVLSLRWRRRIISAV